MAGEEMERTERPTPKRLEEARKKGQVPRSTELNTAAVVLIAGAGLHFMGSALGSSLFDMMRANLSLPRAQALDESQAVGMFAASALHAMLACAPIFGLTLVAALLAPMALGGWNLSFGVLAPDFTRLSPMKGFGRMFSVRGLVELAKAFAKFALIATIAVILLWMKRAEILALGAEPPRAAIGHALTLTGQALLSLAASLALIAAVDVPWQLFQHMKQLRMTRQEIRDELKEAEGNPEVKGRIRQMQQELARRRMMSEVPKADVVVTNPTHFAVALRYDDKRMRAPIVVAKGADLVAARIRELATEHNVPIFEAPPLARALFRSVDLNQEVPANLYVAVAQVLTYVYQLKAARQSGAVPPTPPTIDPPVEETKH
ncbi:MAG TPA: flagellar biosynthesis protein FlhB [Steroidobacteraceae bacterium]|jgi:flagellar biosynthetic protein FlhB|nr:flagellar biosynthesis protein FlhB [Steroidobacteraceae bacterium]